MTQKCLENGQEVEFLKNYKCRQAAKERWAVMGALSSKFEIIQNTLSKSDNRLSVSSLCEIAGVSRSGYYNWLKSEETRRKRDEQDKNDFELILATRTTSVATKKEHAAFICACSIKIRQLE